MSRAVDASVSTDAFAIGCSGEPAGSFGLRGPHHRDGSRPSFRGATFEVGEERLLASMLLRLWRKARLVRRVENCSRRRERHLLTPQRAQDVADGLRVAVSLVLSLGRGYRAGNQDCKAEPQPRLLRLPNEIFKSLSYSPTPGLRGRCPSRGPRPRAGSRPSSRGAAS